MTTPSARIPRDLTPVVADWGIKETDFHAWVNNKSVKIM